MLDLFDAFNLIDRLTGWLHAFRKGRNGKRGIHQIEVARSHGYSGAAIEAHLRHYGVPVFGRRITSKKIIFKVHASQATWAEWLVKAYLVGQKPRSAWVERIMR